MARKKKKWNHSWLFAKPQGNGLAKKRFENDYLEARFSTLVRAKHANIKSF
jgi:hypothetical protein